MPATDAYYDSLFGASAGVGGVDATALGGGKNLLEKLKAGASKNKGAIGSVVGFLLLQQLLDANRQRAERGVQAEGMQAQAGLATPENLYYQAAQPGAREEANMARQALYSQISGGVLGPSLAPGERRIGG